MKHKFISIILAAVLVLGLLPLTAHAAGRTVYFDNTDRWSNVNIYYWSDSSTSFVKWPGTAMKPVEGTIYSFTLPAGVTKVIFNNGTGTQTGDLDLPEDDNLYTYNGDWSDYTKGCDHVWDDGTVTTAPACTETGIRTFTCTLCNEETTEPIAATGHTMSGGKCSVCGITGTILYYENASNWSNVNIYYWSDSSTTMSVWPGEPMTLALDNIYAAVIPAEAQYVIFNNGSTQTEDLTIPGSGWLYGSEGWKEYNVCDHSWDEGTVSTAASCTEDGLMVYKCKSCGESREESIPALGHSFEDGSCTLCGAVENCTEHQWDEGTVTQTATCWVPGSITYCCTLCGAESSETIPAGHKLYTAEVIDPTCTSSGKEKIKCTGCAYVYDKTLPRIDHNYVPGEVIAPTCTEDGYTVGTCDSCGATTQLNLIDHTGHSWDGTVCSVCGFVCIHNYVDGICSHCNKGGPTYVNGYYEIATPAQLYWFAAQVNSGNNMINGKLVADIDLEGGSWTSIGYYLSDTLEPDTVAYGGIFDGQGHTVSNFVTAGTDNEGLFGYCSSATIMNLGVIGATVTGWRGGAIAGYALTSNVIGCFAIDCTIIGRTSNSVAQLSGSVHIAPIASPQGGIIRDCYAINCKLVDDTDLEVNATPVGGTDTQNGYYYNTQFSGTFSSTRNSTAVTMEQLASGEVTYLLNKGITDGTQRWYQTCGTGLPAHSGQTVYAVGDCAGNISGYSNTPSESHKYENGVCTICGAEDPNYAPVIPSLTLQYPTLSFEAEILYNAYFTVDDATSIVEMGMITFPSRLVDGTIEDAVDVIPGYYTTGSSYVVSSNGIPAKNLGDALYFKVYAKLSNGTYAYSDVAGYNAIAYANTILNNAGSSAKAKALVVAMLNYGAAAQTYFGYKSDNLMNAGLTAEQQTLVSAYDETMVNDIVKADADKVGIFVHNGGYSDIYPTVSFEGAFSINYHFLLSKTADGAPTFYYWDADTYASVSELTAGNASGTLTMEANGSLWSCAVSGIAAKQIDETIFIAAIYSSNGNTYTSPVISYSLGSYCTSVAANGEPFGAATAVYGFYAKAYFA
ncbi:MAG: starch-binding protein [Oscillospiraceae bacterium]|nr:starch-binding protein [Oscillospiraceae bacterium]